MHISMFRIYSFNFGRNVTNRGRNTERRSKHNIAKSKFELKSFCPSSCVLREREKIVFRCSLGCGVHAAFYRTRDAEFTLYFIGPKSQNYVKIARHL